MEEMNSKKIINGIIGLMVLLAIVLSYFYLKPAPADDLTLVQTGAPVISVTISPEAQQIIARLNELKRIKLDQGILTSGVFSALADFTVVIPAEPRGVSNPFQKVNF